MQEWNEEVGLHYALYLAMFIESIAFVLSLVLSLRFSREERCREDSEE